MVDLSEIMPIAFGILQVFSPVIYLFLGLSIAFYVLRQLMGLGNK